MISSWFSLGFFVFDRAVSRFFNRSIIFSIGMDFLSDVDVEVDGSVVGFRVLA